MPQSPRELYRLLSFYDPVTGLDALLDRVNFGKLTAAVVQAVAHAGAVPDLTNILAATMDEPVKLLRAALTSPQFRGHTIAQFLNAFPELQRTVFLHIPKCLGTDLVQTLGLSRLTLTKSLEEPSWFSEEDFLDTLGRISRQATLSDEIFVTGHIYLADYLSQVPLRPDDHFFTVLRDPVDAMVSQANYSIGRLLQDPEAAKPDTQHIRACLGIGPLPEAPDRRLLQELALRVLRDPRLCEPQLTCRHLSVDQEWTYRSAVAGALYADIELVTAATYQRWMTTRWGAGQSLWHNRSDKHISREDAMRHSGPMLLEATAEDRAFFSLVTGAIGETNQPSIRARDIVRQFGPQTLAGVPDTLSGLMNTLPPGLDGQPDPVVARGEQMSIDYLRRNVPPGRVMHYHLAFRAGGNAAAYLGLGWSPAEENFIWSMGHESALSLPKPGHSADHVLQIALAPFIVPGVLGFQHLEVLVNGEKVANVLLPEQAVLKIAVPWALLERRPQMEIVLHVPTARRPIDVNGIADDRLLGVSVLEMSVFAEGEATHRLTAPPAPEPPPPDLSPAITPKLPDDLDLVLMFESIGENCEFGLVQRRCGAEPLGLLRFASAPYDKLMAALEGNFVDMGLSDQIEIQISASGREYMVLDRRFGFLFHAWVEVGKKPVNEVHQRETRRLLFLVRKLLEDFASGEKIFVYHAMHALTQAEATCMVQALRRYGPTTLLWVELADASHPPGTVMRLSDGLLKGYIDRFAPGENAHDFSFDCWIEICRACFVAQHAAQPRIAPVF